MEEQEQNDSCENNVTSNNLVRPAWKNSLEDNIQVLRHALSLPEDCAILPFEFGVLGAQESVALVCQVVVDDELELRHTHLVARRAAGRSETFRGAFATHPEIVQIRVRVELGR